MSKYFCEQVIAPGVVIALGVGDNSTWGVTLPYNYWCKNSKLDIVALFEDYSSRGNYQQIPYLQFANGESWKLGFDSFPAHVEPLCWLDDFEHSNINGKAVPRTMRACSRRDGSRYYRELYEELRTFAHGVTCAFTDEELKREPVATKKLIAYIRAIRSWQLENPAWRDWKTVYEQGHPFHFNLF